MHTRWSRARLKSMTCYLQTRNAGSGLSWRLEARTSESKELQGTTLVRARGFESSACEDKYDEEKITDGEIYLYTLPELPRLAD